MHAAHLNNQLERVGGKLTHFLLRTKVNLLHKVLQIYPASGQQGEVRGAEKGRCSFVASFSSFQGSLFGQGPYS